jgi:hypothetical protein
MVPSVSSFGPPVTCAMASHNSSRSIGVVDRALHLERRQARAEQLQAFGCGRENAFERDGGAGSSANRSRPEPSTARSHAMSTSYAFWRNSSRASPLLVTQSSSSTPRIARAIVSRPSES